ncbi:MAG: hypothetical protein V5B30_10240 [Candidatus Accumulibacter delftensis]
MGARRRFRRLGARRRLASVDRKWRSRWRGECLLGRRAVNWLHGTIAAIAGVLAG